jgi:hypothetical protein
MDLTIIRQLSIMVSCQNQLCFVLKSNKYIKSNGEHEELHSIKCYTHLIAEGDPDMFFDKVAESIVVQAAIVDKDVPEEVVKF